MGNKLSMKLIQGLQPTRVLNLLVASQEMEMVVFQHNLIMSPSEDQTRDMLRRIEWSLRKEAKPLPLVDECLTPNHNLIMNIIVWNCKGTLKPSFQNHVRELVHNHNLAILVVMETRIRGESAKEITDRLPFDGFVHTERVQVTLLSNTEQEVHAIVKVLNSDASWMLIAIYASPRTAERLILWNNLIKVSK